MNSYGSNDTLSPCKSEMFRPSRTGCPFAFDDEEFESMSPSSSTRSLGVSRMGGPKEARLKRFAMLGEDQDLIQEKLIPVRIDNIPERLPHEIIRADFSKYGHVVDVKILLNSNNKNRGVGFVKFNTREEATRAAENMCGKIYPGYHVYGEQKGLSCQVAQHSTFFSQNTGALGLTNAPIGEILHKTDKQISQTVSLSDCFARSGYPWGSKHELKRLEPHNALANTLELHTVKLSNLSNRTTEQLLYEKFIPFGKIGNIYIPKPLQVSEYVAHANDPNLGQAFVRFVYKKDASHAMSAMNNTVMEGNVIKCEEIAPHYWPTNTTRRYF